MALIKLKSKGKNSLQIKNLLNRRFFCFAGSEGRELPGFSASTMTISLKSYHQKDKPLTTKQIKLRDFVMGLLLYLISKHNWLQQSISYKHMLMAKLLSKQHHESNLAFLCTTHFKTEFFIKPEMTAASTKLRLTWAAMKVKSNPSPARAGNSCP